MRAFSLDIKNVMAALVVAVIAIGCAGCQTTRELREETQGPVEGAAVAVKLALEVKQQSYNFVVASPDLPLPVVEGMATANFTITELARATGRAAAAYEGADAEIARLTGMGLDVPEVTLGKSRAAMAALNRFLFEGLNPAIGALRQIVLDAKAKDFAEMVGESGSLRKFSDAYKTKNFEPAPQ